MKDNWDDDDPVPAPVCLKAIYYFSDAIGDVYLVPNMNSDLS